MLAPVNQLAVALFMFRLVAVMFVLVILIALISAFNTPKFAL